MAAGRRSSPQGLVWRCGSAAATPPDLGVLGLVSAKTARTRQEIVKPLSERLEARRGVARWLHIGRNPARPGDLGIPPGISAALEQALQRFPRALVRIAQRRLCRVERSKLWECRRQRIGITQKPGFQLNDDDPR